MQPRLFSISIIRAELSDKALCLAVGEPDCLYVDERGPR